MAALESSLITFQTAENPDLSEMHLIRYAYPDISIGDPLGGTDSDTARYVGTDKMNEGNNVTVAYHALANWKGVTNESHNPYPENPGSVTLEDAYNYDIFHLQQYYRINASDGEYVKQAIMEYGAVSGSMGYFATFYNPETAAYYADFDYYTADGEHVVEDAKGLKTKEYVIKRKLMLKIHGIRIHEIF